MVWVKLEMHNNPFSLRRLLDGRAKEAADRLHDFTGGAAGPRGPRGEARLPLLPRTGLLLLLRLVQNARQEVSDRALRRAPPRPRRRARRSGLTLTPAAACGPHPYAAHTNCVSALISLCRLSRSS